MVAIKLIYLFIYLFINLLIIDLQIIDWLIDWLIYLFIYLFIYFLYDGIYKLVLTGVAGENAGQILARSNQRAEQIKRVPRTFDSGTLHVVST